MCANSYRRAADTRKNLAWGLAWQVGSQGLFVDTGFTPIFGKVLHLFLVGQSIKIKTTAYK